MQLTILGMNGPYPAPDSATSGYFVTAVDTRLALDLGTGTLSRLTALTAPEALDALILSHWHYDHCSDVLPLLFRMESAVAAGARPLHIYAPRDEASLVRRAVQGCSAVMLHDLAPGSTVSIGCVTLTAFGARHPVPALMYRLESGGRTLAYTGDTNTTEDLLPLARNASLLLADGLFPAAAWAEGKPHLSVVHAAQLAKEAQAEKLVITHLNPAFDPAALLQEARTIRIDAVLARCGDRHAV